MAKKHQPPMSVDQQIENLKSIGLKIEDDAEAKKFLNNVSYFRLIKAFGLGLKETNSDFKKDITFNQIKGLYLFNAKLRHLIFAELEKVEINLRCRLANYFSCKYGVLGYKESTNFKKPEYHSKFLEEINLDLHRNRKAAFVNNFQHNYEGGELPFYALIELFSFGTLSKFFKNMKNEDKKAIGKMYGVNYIYLESWFEHLAFVRNICAHYGRLYNMNMTITPNLFRQYTDKWISNLRLYGTLVCLKHLLPNDKHWNEFIVEISILLEDFPCVDASLIGFPNKNWAIYLSVPMEDLDKYE